MSNADQELVGVIIDIFEDYIDERIEKRQPEIQTPGIHFAGEDYDKLARSLRETLSTWEKGSDDTHEIIAASRAFENILMSQANPYMGSPSRSSAEEMILQAVKTYKNLYKAGDDHDEFFSQWFIDYPTGLDGLRNEKKRLGIDQSTRAVFAVEKTEREREHFWNPAPYVFPDGWDTEKIAIFGNPDRVRILGGKFRELISVFESMNESNFSLEEISNRLAPLKDIPLANSMESIWKQLVTEYHWTGSQQEDAVCSAMMLLTGAEWTSIEIHGTFQNDWNRLYYIENSISPDEIRQIEAVYFGTGDWWTVTDEDENQYDVYTTEWSPKGRAEQILYKTDRSAGAVIMKTVCGTESFLV